MNALNLLPFPTLFGHCNFVVGSKVPRRLSFLFLCRSIFSVNYSPFLNLSFRTPRWIIIPIFPLGSASRRRCRRWPFSCGFLTAFCSSPSLSLFPTFKTCLSSKNMFPNRLWIAACRPLTCQVVVSLSCNFFFFSFPSPFSPIPLAADVPGGFSDSLFPPRLN